MQGEKDSFVDAEWVTLLPKVFTNRRVEPERLIDAMKDFLTSIASLRQIGTKQLTGLRSTGSTVLAQRDSVAGHQQLSDRR